MDSFVAKFADRITGVLSGFDRLVFRGRLRSIASVTGLLGFLGIRRIPVYEFPAFAKGVTDRLKTAALDEARAQGRPAEYLPSSKTNKEAMAQEIAQRDNVQEGLICLFRCVEPCRKFEVYRNREAKKVEMKSRFGKCDHIYRYWVHPIFGFMSARIQTWFPFDIQVCLNGREWLARDLDAAGIRYERDDNCLPFIEDVARAQKLMDRQVEFPWIQELGRIPALLNPAGWDVFGDMRGDFRGEYYWTVHQSEWATDIMFRDPAALRDLYPQLVRHGILYLTAEDVLRFFGRKMHGNFRGQTRIDLKTYDEGVRLKYWLQQNSLKMYNKSTLRIETTINQARHFKVFRATEGDPSGERAWLPLRESVADLHRRTEVSQSANKRYLDALSAADTSTPLGKLLETVSQPVEWKGKRVRGLRPTSPEDAKLLEAVNRGEFCLNGFRNRDLKELLYTSAAESPQAARSRSARVTRLIRILRGHGLVTRVPKSFLYRLTAKGRETANAAVATRQLTLRQLATLAA